MLWEPGLFQAPGVQEAKGSHQAAASTECIFERGMDKHTGQCARAWVGHGGPVEKALGLELKSATGMFYVLGQVNPLLGLHFPKVW